MGFKTGDTIDAANFVETATTYNFVENIARTSGTLILHDAGLAAHILLSGDYTKSDFSLAHDHGTGTLVMSEPAAPSFGSTAAAGSRWGRALAWLLALQGVTGHTEAPWRVRFDRSCPFTFHRSESACGATGKNRCPSMRRLSKVRDVSSRSH
jgi:hypothetical protein